MLQMSLEWMGFETEFHDVATGRPKEELDPRFCAIILDSALEIPFADEDYYLKWIVKQKERGLKVLFVGGYPGDDKDRRQAMATALGIRGTTEEVIGAKSAKFTTMDKTMVNESLLLRPRMNGLVSAQAPQDSKVWLSVTAVDQRDIELTDDVVYTAPWGGALLDPYLYFRTSAEDVRAVIDPFTFLATIMPQAAFPVPDTTTRDGLRLFLTHIDGDGFTTLSKRLLNVTCAEIIRDEFIKKYPFPVTVSVIESEVKSLLKEQEPNDRARFEEIARTLYAMDKVQVASHAWSHPFVWMPGKDLEGGRGYATQWLEFADPTTYPTFDLRREIEGSVRYINETLTTKDKPVELFLWSGNCRPSGEALKMVADLGMEALNGGNTTVNRRAEGIAAISSKDTFMDGELQVYAPVQNEYTYTNGFTGPLYGGFRLVIDTFERTETPRRLKPVNVYYHFYSVQSGESERALRDIHEWCLARPLHSVTARDFVRLAKDARATKIATEGPKRWILENAGVCRTFRLPKAMGVPNLARCENVIGYNDLGDQLYIHTTGHPRAVLDFSESAGVPTQPWMVSSSGELEFSKLELQSVEGSIWDLRPNQVDLAGFTPGEWYDLTATPSSKVPEKARAQVDNQGHLRLTLPAVCGFVLSRDPNAQASQPAPSTKQ